MDSIVNTVSVKWLIESRFNHSLNGSKVMCGVVCSFVCVCVCVVATVLFSRSVQRVVKDSSCDAADYLQPRLLQKLNCRAERDVSWTENRNNESLMSG